jgi:imidazolonepropionase-like amidohydrolase
MPYAMKIWNWMQKSLDALLLATLVLPIFLVFATGQSLAQATANADFVIRNVRIFDGTKVIDKGQVWIAGGKIKAVGADVKAPASIQGIDGQGDTLLPGLIDSHTHAWGGALKEALVFGVTTELDMFTDHSYAAQIRGEQAVGKDLDMADLRSAGTLVTAPKGHGTEYGMPIPTITSPAEAQAFVDARIAEGSDYIKIIYDDGKAYGMTIPTISKETMCAVVTSAHKRGKLAVAHIGTLQGATDAISCGVDGLAHLFIDAPADAAFADLVAQHHAFVVPTLSVLATITRAPGGKMLSQDAQLQPYLTPTSMKNLGGAFPNAHGDFTIPQKSIQLLKARHVPILAGTDSPNPGTVHGASMHGELEMLVAAGLTPVEALASATSVPAKAFHLADRGEIAVGKRADLLLVKGDPTTSIKDTRNIVSVWKVGVKDDRDAYRAQVDQEKRAEDAQKQAPAPQGSDAGLISDFEDGKPSVKFGFGWTVSTDAIRGGKSTADMKVVSGGAQGSKSAMEVNGEISEGPVSWAGAMYFPGPAPMSPANLAGKKNITFWARGDARKFQVMVYSQSGGYIPKVQNFNAGADWTKVTLPLSSFETDGHDVTAIFFGAFGGSGKFTLTLDNVGLE